MLIRQFVQAGVGEYLVVLRIDFEYFGLTQDTNGRIAQLPGLLLFQLSNYQYVQQLHAPILSCFNLLMLFRFLL
jgi:hypothetical protein